MNDKAKDLHSGDLDALKKVKRILILDINLFLLNDSDIQAVKGLNANIGYADIFYQNLCLRKLPDKKCNDNSS